MYLSLCAKHVRPHIRMDFLDVELAEDCRKKHLYSKSPRHQAQALEASLELSLD